MISFAITTPRGTRTIGGNAPCFIVAEMSANHGQDFEKAKAIVRAAAQAGADAIKLQTYTPDTITIQSDKEWFVVKNEDNPDSWQKKTLYDLYQTAYTPWEWHAELKVLAESLGLVFFSTPFDETAVDFLETLNVPMYKIASYEATDYVLLRKVAKTGKPVILSVGFAQEEEVAFAVETLRAHGAKDIALLHCVTAYTDEPVLEETNLNTMLHLRDRFDVVCGFSDNNAGVEIPVTAAVMGASIIEKHVVADPADAALDARFSLGPAELKETVERIRRAGRIKGTVRYGCQSDKEKKNTFFRRSLFVVKDIAAGEMFTKEHVRSIRPSAGLPTRHIDEVIGKRAASAVERGTPLSWDMIADV